VSAGKVDVLAVMDGMRRAAGDWNETQRWEAELAEARAAVAALIEEARAVLSVMHAVGLDDSALRAALAQVQP
jgi:hypothetical protein